MTMTVLTVDDSRTMREMLRLALCDAGFRVVQAEDGIHGLEVLAAESPQVLRRALPTPSGASARARWTAFVSTVNPRSSSSPIVKISSAYS